MKITLKEASDIGPVVWAVRKSQGIRQDDTAGAIGVSENFLGKIERGGETVQWGKLFRVLNDLGIRLSLDLPAGMDEQIQEFIARRKSQIRR
jgi:transcriptional regulator with XRE-family HTH domain